nr:acylphosphatase [Alteribacter salitolerans]
MFSLASDKQTHFFFRSRGDEVTEEAIEICKDKNLTKEYLKRFGVPSPEGRRFTEKHTNEEVLSYACDIGYPLVLKPTNGSLGKGVIANILDEKGLLGALGYVKDELGYSDIILEKYIEGTEYRVYVVNDQVIGAVEKLPPNVTGDGSKTIEELIKIKNKEKKDNPHLSKRHIKIDYEVVQCIEYGGYSLNSVLEDGKTIYLRKKNSLSSGGEPVDATDKLSDKVKKIAVDSLKAIPDLPQAGLDLIVDHRNNTAAVIEINATAMIGSHLFPEKGLARDIPSAIIDYYFPESKGVEKASLSFDFNSIKAPFESSLVEELKILPAEQGKLYAKKYIVSGKVQKVGYRQWIRRKALQQGLHGYTRNLKNGRVVVVVAGTDETKVSNFKSTCHKGPSKAAVQRVTEYSWEKPLKTGFEIKNDAYKTKKQKEKNVLAPERTDLKVELEKLKKENSRIKSSKSWKYTLPLRKVLKKLNAK